MKLSPKQIVKSATLKCPVEKAFAKWTTQEGLRTFFGADNKIELKPGGAFEIYFMLDKPMGLRGSEGCKVLSYVPNKLFSFTWNAPPMLMEQRNSGYYTWVVLEFKESEGQTQVQLTHLGWPEDKAWDAVFDYFDSAWGRVMEGFKNSL